MSPTQRIQHSPSHSRSTSRRRIGAATARTAIGTAAAAAIALVLVAGGLVTSASADDADTTTTAVTTEAQTPAAPVDEAAASEAPAAQVSTEVAPAAAAEAPAAPEASVVTPSSEKAAPQSPPAEPAAACIPDNGISYVYNKADNSGSITVTDPGSVSGALCTPLYISLVTWNYTTDATWPQTLDTANYLFVDKAGTYPFTAPVTCGQGDVYVHRLHYIVPTATIDGPQLWEDFLNTLGFSSTTPGYTAMLSPLDCFGEVTPVAPELVKTGACGTYGSVTPAVTEGVVYTTVFDDKTGAYSVTATPAEGKHFAGDDQTVVYKGNVGAYVECPTVKVEGDPEAVPQVCDTENPDGVISGYITVVPVEGVSYSIHPLAGGADIAVTSTTTPVVPGTYEVTATANPGVILTGVTSWTRTVINEAISCDVPTLAFLSAAVGHIDPACGVNPTNGAITIDPTDGVTYSIGSQVLTAARTTFAPGAYTVVATAPEGDVIDGQSVFPVRIASAPTDCGQLTTLAIGDPGTLASTGFSGMPLYLGGSALLLLLGGGLLVWSRRRSA